MAIVETLLMNINFFAGKDNRSLIVNTSNIFDKCVARFNININISTNKL